MNAPKRSRARVLIPEGLQKLRERVRSHEVDENAGFKYTLERLGELTGLDPETVKNVLDCKGSDKRTIARCFESFGLTLAESDHIPATQATTTADPNFVGRDEAIVDLNTLVSRNAKVIVIQARGGVGKTTLARKYLQQEFDSFLEFPIAKETKDIASIEGLLEEKLRQLGEEPGREFLVSLDRLKRKLQAERIGILIDNLEPALDSAGKFIEAHRRYVELLRVLSDPIVQSITLITSRERLREADVTVQHYPLRSLDVQAWAQFFQSRSINADTPALATLHDAYGGNAKAMDIISGAVLEDFSGDVEAYWQANQDDLFIERDLEDLVAKQFDRLQQLDPDAYKLLCRMGCYRYQDVPMVPIEGLFCLLWDVPENRHRRVIKSLQDRSLVDCENGEYWLHPVVRAEAIDLLRRSPSWEISNQRCAEFWTQSIDSVKNLKDGVKALESYYHYVEINEFEQAGNVILNERHNELTSNSSLAYSLIRVGLLQQSISAINLIISNLNDDYTSIRLWNIMGTFYWILGHVNEAIELQIKVQKVLTVSLANTPLSLIDKNLLWKLKIIESSTFINLTVCMIDLWELEESMYFCLRAKELSEKSGYKKHIGNSLFLLAFLSSHFGRHKEAILLAEESESFEELTEWGQGNQFLFLGQTYKNLNQLKRARESYTVALSHARSSQYIQVEGKALCGLSEIERIQQNFKKSLLYNAEAVKMLEKIGAKCDLAEAYYQLGMTYRLIDQEDESKEAFQEAIRLFDEIRAPKQVDRVRQSMQNSL
jgi:tetratricopeptide (TPR) repeat protein